MKLGQYLTFIFLFPFYQVIKIDRFLRIYPQKRILPKIRNYHPIHD